MDLLAVGEALLTLLMALSLVVGLGMPLLVAAMTGALSSVKVRHRPAVVRLSSLDGVVFGVVVFLALWLAVAAVSLDGWTTGGGVALVGLLVACGCRVRVDVTSERAWATRCVLFVLPYRRVALERPEAFVDGWGDEMDPEALHVGDPGSWTAELGWVTKGADAEALAAEFNDAVRALRRADQGRPPDRD